MDPNTNSTETPVPQPTPQPVPQTPSPAPTPSPTPPPTPTPIPQAEASPPAESAPPQAVVGSFVSPAVISPGADINTPQTQPTSSPLDTTPLPTSKRSFKKPLLVALIVLVVLGGGAAAYYFGYYNNPALVYSQSLSNTGKGFDKLVDYVDTQSQLKYKGSQGEGTYSFKSASFSTDGKVAYKSDDNNGEVTFDVGLAATRVNADIIFLKSSSTTPDVYIKAGGIKGLGGLLGSPEMDAKLNQLDNTWIAIDHTLLDTYTQAATSEQATPSTPTRDQIMDEVKAFGNVNQEFVYSTDKDKAVLKVVKRYGSENVDGHKTFHYQVAFQKENVKKYIKAQQAALKTSKLDKWLKDNKYDKQSDSFFSEMEKSADSIKPTDTFDMWMDKDHRIIYKVRAYDDKKNPGASYVDLGLDYKGGDKYPFFLSGQSKQGSSLTAGKLVATLDAKTGSVGFGLNINSGDNGTVRADFKIKPTNDSVKISKPANSKPLAQVLSELGYGDALNQLQTLSAQSQ